MKEQNKKVVASILCSTIIVFVNIGLGGVFYFFTKEYDLNILRLCLFVLLCVVIVFNVICFFKITAKYKKMNGQDVLTYLLQSKDIAEKEYLHIQQNNIKKVRLHFFYSVFVILLLNVNIILFLNPSTSMICLILSLFLFYIFNSFFSSYFEIRYKDKEQLKFNENKVEELYALVDKVKTMYKFNIKYKLVFSLNNSISIAKVKKNAYISIGFYALMNLSKEELESVIIHEFAHHLNEDTKNSEKYYKLLNILHCFQGVSLCVMPFSAKVSVESQTMQFLSTRFYEMKADDLVKEKHMANQFVNALAKLRIFDYYFDFALFEGSFFAKQETVPARVSFEEYDNFLAYYRHNKIFLDENVVKELTPRFATHLSLKDRMTLLDIQSLDYVFDKTAFVNSTEYLNEYFITLYKKSYMDEYKQAHKFYVDFQEKIKVKEPLEDLSIQEKDSLMDEAFRVNEFLLCRRLAESIISESKNQSRALCLRGIIKLKLDNDISGLEDLNKIFFDKRILQFKEDCFKILGDYYAFIGDESTIISMREKQIDIFNQVQAYEKMKNISKKDVLIKISDEEIINKIIKYAEKYEDIVQIGVGKKVVDGNEGWHVIVLTKMYSKQNEKIYDEFFSFLDTLDDYLYFLQIFSENSYNKGFIKKITIFTKK